MEYVLALILKYKYLILFPIACFEGPVVGLLSGFLVHTGFLSFIPTFSILILGDLIPDIVLYNLGYHGEKVKFIKKVKEGESKFSKNYKLVEKLWNNHGYKTMFFGKIAYGMAVPFLLSAGFVKIKFSRFLKYSFPVTVFQISIVFIMGYIISDAVVKSGQSVLSYVTIVSILLLFVASVYFLSINYLKKKMIEGKEH